MRDLSLCFFSFFTFWVTSWKSAREANTSRPLCFTTGFPGAPNGPTPQHSSICSNSVHRLGIKNHGGGNGHTQAQCGKQDKSGDQCPGNRPQRIDPIELTDSHAQFGRIPGDAANEDWKCAPHEEGRNEQHHGCAEESQREQKRLQATNARIHRYIERTHASKACE